MRILKGGIQDLSNPIKKDLESRNTGLSLRLLLALADLVAVSLVSSSSNSCDWIPILPRTANRKAKERHISRFLSNSNVSCPSVMTSFVQQIISKLSLNDNVVVLMLDQSKIAKDFECLMVSVRIGKRALSVLWTVVKTNGSIGFNVQKQLLDKVK
jgi:hypothetical protein